MNYTQEPSRMLLVDTRAQQLGESTVGDLPRLLAPRDLLVVNDAATLPASLPARTARGESVEVRLLEGPYEPITRAVLLGAGDFRTPTELRPAPPVLAVGDVLAVGPAELAIASVSRLSPRLVELRWPADLAARFALLYRAGRPVQYSYIESPLELWDVQNTFAARPWAVEMPSAARPLRGALLLALRARGVSIATLTHAAGLSSTGDASIDAMLPLPERYEIPSQTVQAIERAQTAGGRVIAVGTSVVRALEDSAQRNGVVTAGVQLAELVLDEHTRPRVASGLLTGIHMPGESHYRLLSAFARADTLARATALAHEHDYRLHEFGDAALLLPNAIQAACRAA